MRRCRESVLRSQQLNVEEGKRAPGFYHTSEVLTSKRFILDLNEGRIVWHAIGDTHDSLATVFVSYKA